MPRPTSGGDCSTKQYQTGRALEREELVLPNHGHRVIATSNDQLGLAPSLVVGVGVFLGGRPGKLVAARCTRAGYELSGPPHYRNNDLSRGVKSIARAGEPPRLRTLLGHVGLVRWRRRWRYPIDDSSAAGKRGASVLRPPRSDLEEAVRMGVPTHPDASNHTIRVRTEPLGL